MRERVALAIFLWPMLSQARHPPVWNLYVIFLRTDRCG